MRAQRFTFYTFYKCNERCVETITEFSGRDIVIAQMLGPKWFPGIGVLPGPATVTVESRSQRSERFLEPGETFHVLRSIPSMGILASEAARRHGHQLRLTRRCCPFAVGGARGGGIPRSHFSPAAAVN